MRQLSLQTTTLPTMKPTCTNAKAAVSTWYGRRCGLPLRPHTTWQTSRAGLTREPRLLHPGFAFDGCHLSWLNMLHQREPVMTSRKALRCS